MTITRLSLTDFRSYGDGVLTPGPGLVVLTGENGAGKTNILEAVSLLVPGRGLRGAPLGEMARQGGNGGFGVAARLGETDLGTGTLASAPERRQVRINGAAASVTALSEWLSILWITPAMDRLFLDGASGRRRFLDRLALALFPAHAGYATRYEAAMRQRNRLLADDAPADPDWLAALEGQMAEHGSALDAHRKETVSALSALLVTRADGPFARPEIALAGWDGGDLATSLRTSRARDRAAGRTTQGPHRIDLAVTHQAKGQSAALCSTGEQKALLLSIILAHADLVADRAGQRPLLLLDEVAAHLDPLRRAALIAHLETAGGQVWMTGTDAVLFDAADARATRYVVREGVVETC